MSSPASIRAPTSGPSGDRVQRRDRRSHRRWAGHPGRDLGCCRYRLPRRAESPRGPYFEAAIVHQTDCGAVCSKTNSCATGSPNAQATTSRCSLRCRPPTPPKQSAPTSRRCSPPRRSHPHHCVRPLYDLDSGLVTTVVEPRHPRVLARNVSVFGSARSHSDAIRNLITSLPGSFLSTKGV